MALFRRRKPEIQPIPEPFSAEDIRVESSICTGEKTVGFYDRGSHKLRFAELVRSEQDVLDFFARYGLTPDPETLRRLMSD
jgi:hypothetical protein